VNTKEFMAHCLFDAIAKGEKNNAVKIFWDLFHEPEEEKPTVPTDKLEDLFDDTRI